MFRRILLQTNKNLSSLQTTILPVSASVIISCKPQICQKRMASSKHGISRRLLESQKSLWVEFSKLALEHNALNLGQGFPDFQPPQFLLDALKDAAANGNYLMNQYTRGYGHPRLVNAIADVYSPIMERKIDPMSEILISVGAYGSLFCSLQGMINDGDEVIIIEPFFDCYDPMVKVAGGVPVFVPLRPTKTGVSMATSSADWKLDEKELESKFNEKTKAIIINTPNNPLGKVFSREELDVIARLCIKYDVICISDEVYEWLVFDDNKHIKIATLPGMWERTLTIGSAGKTFSATGWKLGWTIGPSDILVGAKTMHQNCNYTCPTILQEATAVGFEHELKRMGTPECYFSQLPKELEPKRDKLINLMTEMGMWPVIPQGGYFLLADITGLNIDLSQEAADEPKDFQFVKWMTKNKKLTAIPPSAFYCKEHQSVGENYVRLCFIKEDETLEKASKILRQWKSSM
ncbi:kynurenine--oxoglutarate transaminase 3 isoform X1 [Patella vulgata]|uniref:kynurenine--oxoglutarate transaminase 3 isoform X1 n=2 Tax=Patella vulgata TaxID=6465 RepID=UPI00217F7E37|nr:kynurenine--oxoglutarate transaminase 3 isoform X1 [Patella vulgata]